MNGCQTRVYKFEQHAEVFSRFRYGVSLHSHTMHSREYLGRLPTYIAKFPIGSYILEREIGRLHLYEGRIFDFKKVYWTPPLSPREAHELEKQQIKKKLGLRALVSLSDHDNVEAGLHLRMLAGTSQAPVSVEWTVPFEKTVLHLGIHNLAADRANAWMKELAAFTANREPATLRFLLEELNADPSVLVILNHPYWDAESVGPAAHRASLTSFLHQFQTLIHALELNGMRSRRENREVLKLGEQIGLPVVSGGDRHGCEPNATLNVTAAANFDEFVDDIRQGHNSEIVLMPQFFEPLQLRLLENAWHAMADAPGEFGRRHWMSRVFIEEEGAAKALSHYTGTRFHRVIDKFRWVMGLVANPVLRPALKLPFRGNEEGGL
jgi:hypothetical protein